MGEKLRLVRSNRGPETAAVNAKVLPQPSGLGGLMFFAGAGVFAQLAAAADVHLVFGAGVAWLGVGRTACLHDKDVAFGLGKGLGGNEGIAFAFEDDLFAAGVELSEDGGCPGAGSCGLFLCVEEGDGHDAFGTDQQFGLVGRGADESAAVRTRFELFGVGRCGGEEDSSDSGEERAGETFRRGLHGCWFFLFG